MIQFKTFTKANLEDERNSTHTNSQEVRFTRYLLNGVLVLMLADVFVVQDLDKAGQPSIEIIIISIIIMMVVVIIIIRIIISSWFKILTKLASRLPRWQ